MALLDFIYRQPGVLNGSQQTIYDPLMGGYRPPANPTTQRAMPPGSSQPMDFGQGIVDFFRNNPAMISTLASSLGSAPSFGQGFAQAAGTMPQALAFDKGIVDRAASRKAMTAYLKANKTLMKEITDTFGPLKKKAHEAHGALVAAERKHLEPLEKAESVIKGKMSTWAIEQELIRVAKESELRAAAQKAEEERRLAEAQAAEDRGDKAEAAQLLAAPVDVPVVQVQSAAPEIKGIAYVENWSCEVLDEKQVPREYLLVDTKALNQMAKALKSKFNVPGCKARMVKTTRVG